MRLIAVSCFLSLPLLAGCQAAQDFSMVRPLTYQDIQAHNNWVQIKKRAVKPKPFEGKPIQVKGIGRVKAVPNIAVITGEIEAEAEADDEAVDTAAKIINAVQEALKDQKADVNFTNISAVEKRDDDCQTHNAEVRIRYSEIISDNQHNANIKSQIERGINTKSKPREAKKRLILKLCPVLEMQARIGFVVRIEPADAAADVINILTNAGVEKVDLYGYDFEDYDALYKEAAAKAVKDAKTKAELIASRAGTQLTDITSFSVGRPERTSRFGPQAMIITNHGNRNVAAGQYNNLGGAVINSGPMVELVNVPPVFETVVEPVVVQEASTELVTIPATYQTVSETIVVQPQYAAGDGSIVPAVTKQVSRRVVRTPASTQERVIPAITKMETRRVIKVPARTIERFVPQNANTSNALKLSLAGARTITVNASLTYNYKTPIDGTLPKPETSK